MSGAQAKAAKLLLGLLVSLAKLTLMLLRNDMSKVGYLKLLIQLMLSTV